MRVLLINTVDTARNGITGVIMNHIHALKDSGIVFDLVAINEPLPQYVDAVQSSGGSIYVIPRRIKKVMQYFAEIKNLVRKNSYDIVHIHGNSGTCAIEVMAAKMAGKSRVVVHAHNTFCKYQLIHKVFGPVMNVLADGRLACSEPAGRFMFGEKPYLVLNNGIDVERNRYNAVWSRQIRQKHHISDDAIVVGHVGTFNYAKNHEFLLQIFHSFHITHSNAVLLLIGEGEAEGMIRNQIQELGLQDSVILVGSVDNVNEYLSAFDCFLLPSRFEGLPLVLLEAQASGLSCVASTGVPTASNIADSVQYIGLDKPVEVWAEALHACISRADRSKKSDLAIGKLSDCGYCVEKVGGVLKRYYTDISK